MAAARPRPDQGTGHAETQAAVIAQRGLGWVNRSQELKRVFIRRALGLLRRAGLVNVQHGAGAGWTLARPADQISLLSVHDAVEPEAMFSMHPAKPNQGCPVGRGIQPTLSRVYQRVDDALRRELATTSISDVLAQTLAAPRT